MVSSRLRTTIVFFALCGLVAGSAFAGTLANAPTNFAHEIAISTQDLTFAAQVYTMGIARNAGQNFILRYTLNGANFGAVPALSLTYTAVAPSTGVVAIVQRSGGSTANTVEYDINVTSGTLANDTFTLNGAVRFPAGAAVGATATITVDLRDVIPGALDTVGTFQRNLAVLAGAASVTATAQVRATIDATAAVPSTTFVAQGSAPFVFDDDTTLVAKAAVATASSTALVRSAGGVANYTLVAADQVTITLTGDFSGISQVGFDLDGNGAILPLAGSNTSNVEVFTIAANLQSATLTVDGSRLGVGGTAIWFTKTAGTVLNPRTFGISATVNPTAATGRATQSRSIGSNATDWFVWVQNGTTLLAPYVSFTPGNGVKFRFTNSASTAITVLVGVVLDQGVATQNVSTFTIPPASSQQITFSENPSSGTGELGPIATLVSGIAPVRAKVTFTALTATANIAGVELIYSPVGVVTLVNLPQNPSW